LASLHIFFHTTEYCSHFCIIESWLISVTNEIVLQHIYTRTITSRSSFTMVWSNLVLNPSHANPVYWRNKLS